MTPSLTCDDAREALWPDPHTSGAAREARAHYDVCPECRRFFEIQGILGTRLGRVARPDAPEHLRERVRTALRHDLPARRLAPRWWGAAALAAAALITVAVLSRSGTADLGQPLVTEVASADVAFVSSDIPEVEAWLAQRLGRAVEVPAITDARLRGARIVTVDGMPTAAAVFEMHGVALTYLAVPGFRISGQRVDPGEEIRVSHSGELVVAVWGERDGAKVVAAPMPRDEVIAIAAECRTKGLMRSAVPPDGPLAIRRRAI